MITPSFSPTATERVLPKLALDFTTASLDPRVTFARTTDATHPATYVASTGYVTAATNNQPRFDYNPITLACKGLLIEESRANLCTYSEDYTDAAYTFTDISIGSNQTAAPDNANTADLWTQGTAGTGVSYRTAGITVSAGATISFSVFAKRSASMQWVRIRLSNNANTNGGTAWFDLTNGVLGTVSNAGTGTNTSATISSFANGFYRLTVTTTVGAADTSVNRYVFSTTADNTTTRQSNAAWYMWGEQLEAAAFATSYIPTTSAALTRNADVATMTGTNFSSWFNASEGTFVCQADRTYTGNFAAYIYPFSASDGTGNNEINAYCIPSGTQTAIGMTVSGAGQLDYSARAWNAEPSIVAVGYKQNNTQFGMNGVTNTADTTCSIPTVTQLAIGRRNTSGYWTGHIKKLNYYVQKLTGSELAAFSK